MIVGLRNCIDLALRASVSCAILLSTAGAQQPPPAPTPAQSPSNPVASTNPAAQVDQLLKKANEQMNMQGHMKEALEICEQVLTLAREAGNRKALSRALNNIASVLRDMGRYEDSLNYYNQVIALARELKDLPMQWTATRNIGVLYD